MERAVEELCQKHGTLIRLEKNVEIPHGKEQGEASCVYYLVEGVCALCGNSYHGQERVILYHTAGQMLGINPYISGRVADEILYSGSVSRTRTRCTLYRIPASEFSAYRKQNLEFSNYVSDLLSRYLHLTLSHLKQIQENSTVTNVCHFMLTMCEEYEDGQWILPRFYTYDEISKYLGVHMVTVSRIAAQLLRMGYVRRVSGGLLLCKKEKLEEIVVGSERFKY